MPGKYILVAGRRRGAGAGGSVQVKRLNEGARRGSLSGWVRRAL